MTIKISTMVPQIIPLTRLDPTGETKVTVVPPGWNEERIRGGLLAKRKYSRDDIGRLVTEVDCNIRELWESEIWLTYGESNVVVEIDRGTDEPETLSIVGDKDSVTFKEFMTTLEKMPPQVVYAWHEAVAQVVEDWRNPF